MAVPEILLWVCLPPLIRDLVVLTGGNSTQFGRRVNGDPKEMAKLVSRFATGVIATLDIDNPRIRAQGLKPWVGVLFKVSWWKLVRSPPPNPAMTNDW